MFTSPPALTRQMQLLPVLRIAHLSATLQNKMEIITIYQKYRQATPEVLLTKCSMQ